MPRLVFFSPFGSFIHLVYNSTPDPLVWGWLQGGRSRGLGDPLVPYNSYVLSTCVPVKLVSCADVPACAEN